LDFQRVTWERGEVKPKEGLSNLIKKFEPATGNDGRLGTSNTPPVPWTVEGGFVRRVEKQCVNNVRNPISQVPLPDIYG